MIQLYIPWEGEGGYDENKNTGPGNKNNNSGLVFYLKIQDPCVHEFDFF